MKQIKLSLAALLFFVCLFNLANAQNWLLIGNAGTTPGTHFIGTTDAKDLVFKTVNAERWRISQTGRLLTTQTSIFIGNLSGNETNTGNQNVAIGNLTLNANTNGFQNTAVGDQALKTNSTGQDNTAIGRTALFLANASFNTAVGSASMLYTTSGTLNVGVGIQTLHFTSTGSNNTAIGSAALLYNTASNNTGVGFQALLTNTSGSNNTTLGYNSDVTVNNLTNATAIGYSAKVSASNSLVLGGTGANLVNVGIGITAPTARLEVNSTTVGLSGLKFTQLTSASGTATANNKSLSVDASGNVILVPAAAADGSTTKVNGGTYITVTGTGTTATPYLVASNGPWTPAALGTGNIINNNTGKVIIGTGITSLPGAYKLYVSDGILAERVKVALKSSTYWADYVFDKDYNLKPLSEVESFIKVYKHLPGLPSGDKLVKDGGIDVNEMFARQMEKIEELTLYIIEQSKKIKALENKINGL